MGKKMRLSARMIAGVVLVALASPVAAGQPGGCEASKTRNVAGCAPLVSESRQAAQYRTFADQDRDVADYAEDNHALSDISRYIEMIRLDTKDPDTHRDRSTKDQAKSDLNQIIVYYNAAIKTDPKDDDAYFHRALANFYAGSLLKARADLSQASKLDPEYPYYALWIDIIDTRDNLESNFSQAISKIDMAKWPAPVIRLFLGQTTPAAVLAAADDPDPKTKRGQVCEANFYIGELALQQGSKEEAARLFRLSAADCPREFVEGHSASAELEALGGSQ
jgi:tetratricopeptide (TPR) repeat protein